MEYREVIAALDYANMEISRVDPMLALQIAQIANQLEYDWLSNNKGYRSCAKNVKRRRKSVSSFKPVVATGAETRRLVYWN